MSDPWVWCTCTTARVWGESLASSSSWLSAQVAAASFGAATPGIGEEALNAHTESTSASYATASGSTLDTTTTRIPALSSANRSG